MTKMPTEDSATCLGAGSIFALVEAEAISVEAPTTVAHWFPRGTVEEAAHQAQCCAFCERRSRAIMSHPPRCNLGFATRRARFVFVQVTVRHGWLRADVSWFPQNGSALEVCP